ncbi:MAG: Fe-S cluster assembly scaffold protein NifU [Planctomycetota bacterium]|jgi:nitrogen fixation NifU-like protein
MYSDKVMEHFTNPRNVGEIQDPDGVGEVGNPVCGDMMTFHVKVKDGRLEDVKFRTFGCGAAIAVSSMVSEMAKGKTVEEALEISNKNVASELGGLPKHKLHCSNLGADALHKAIEDYLAKAGQGAPSMPPGGAADLAESEALDHEGNPCRCPYCDAELPEGTPFCEPCGVEITYCPSCEKPVPVDAKACPDCGTEPERANGGDHE